MRGLEEREKGEMSQSGLLEYLLMVMKYGDGALHIMMEVGLNLIGAHPFRRVRGTLLVSLGDIKELKKKPNELQRRI